MHVCNRKCAYKIILVGKNSNNFSEIKNRKPKTHQIVFFVWHEVLVRAYRILASVARSIKHSSMLIARKEQERKERAKKNVSEPKIQII